VYFIRSEVGVPKHSCKNIEGLVGTPLKRIFFTMSMTSDKFWSIDDLVFISEITKLGLNGTYPPE
jgi:hypothetical protein